MPADVEKGGMPPVSAMNVSTGLTRSECVIHYVSVRHGKEELSMKRNKILSLPLLVAVTLMITSIISAGVAFATGYFYDFSSGLSPWTGGKDANVTAYSLTLSPWDNGTSCPSPVDRFALLTLEGRTDDVSGIWMQAKFPTTSASTTSVTVDFDVKDKGGCSNCKALAYIGASAPTSTTQFTSITSPPSSWTRYSHSATVFADDVVYVALGFRLGSSTPLAVGFDCVKVTVTP
jgi:hypothetical protein